MTHKVLIDNDIHGWATNNESRIRKEYEKILHVGEESTPLPDSPDKVIATYCEENNCDLLTGDKRAYTELLDNYRVKAVQISKYGKIESDGKYVYLVKIL